MPLEKAMAAVATDSSGGWQPLSSAESLLSSEEVVVESTDSKTSSSDSSSSSSGIQDSVGFTTTLRDPTESEVRRGRRRGRKMSQQEFPSDEQLLLIEDYLQACSLKLSHPRDDLLALSLTQQGETLVFDTVVRGSSKATVNTLTDLASGTVSLEPDFPADGYDIEEQSITPAGVNEQEFQELSAQPMRDSITTPTSDVLEFTDESQTSIYDTKDVPVGPPSLPTLAPTPAPTTPAPTTP
eukprot:CAMPEP_0117665200 /NCGR_PEP_ID=MMETSP0804-20121206/9673_1 /TAXON_ID=1074897 /ORGANISM="Tetraselmis astigmatica, Strain CCMP880" /LENGTH=239 /DNA_ID=CAMNT_0005472577 /DNA_START=185 /DNA_END=901 /DNA_ORIENTATION=+